MAQAFDSITPALQEFIAHQHIFFVATAAAQGPINLSPKGMDTLRVTDPHGVVWLNLTGSGNETAAHLGLDGRMTLMFCAFTGKPQILRLYGQAVAHAPGSQGWQQHMGLFPAIPGGRQIIQMQVTQVVSSCGFAVPFMDFRGERDLLARWAETKGEDGLHRYWAEKNQTSLGGLPTGMADTLEKLGLPTTPKQNLSEKS